MKAEYIFSILDDLKKTLDEREVLFAYIAKESSDFIRFSKAAIRQPGSVLDQSITLTMIAGGQQEQRQVRFSCNLTGDLQTDKEVLHFTVKWLQQEVETAPTDPYILYDTEVKTFETTGSKNATLDARGIVEDVLARVVETDFVGILASGSISKFLWSSLGHRYEHSVDTFNLDSSFHRQGDKAIKQIYAGQRWDKDEFSKKCDLSLKQLDILKKPAKSIDPDNYRVYLAPAALEELFGVWSWSGFSQKAVQTKSAPFIKWLEGETPLSEKLSVTQDNVHGFDCRFDGNGFLLPEKVSLIEEGMFKDALTSPRTAQEYGLGFNSSRESPSSLIVDMGDLKTQDILEELGTGIYCSNLWYLNYSDMPSGRITGMTRFGCFWVEDGQLQAPISVMRFDDSLQNILGKNLERVTSEDELILDSSSYYGRTLKSGRYPGALLSRLRFTL